MLLEAAVLAEQVAVIAREDHEGVARVRRAVEGGEDDADVLVHELRRRVIRRDDALAVRVGELAKDVRQTRAVGGADRRSAKLPRVVRTRKNLPPLYAAASGTVWKEFERSTGPSTVRPTKEPGRAALTTNWTARHSAVVSIAAWSFSSGFSMPEPMVRVLALVFIRSTLALVTQTERPSASPKEHPAAGGNGNLRYCDFARVLPTLKLRKTKGVNHD